MEIIAEHGTLLLILACTFGFFMAWGAVSYTHLTLPTNREV